MATLTALRLDEIRRGRPAHPALVLPGRSIGYAELIDRVHAAAGRLARAGCRPTAPVGVSVDDDLDNLVTSVALLWLGVPQIALPASDPLPLRRELANRLSMTHVVADDDRQALAGIPMIRVERDAEAAGAPAIAGEPDSEALAIYATSSGTTGKAKLFGYSQRAFARRAESIAVAQGYAIDERIMVAMPVATHTGKFARLVAIWHGATAVLATGGPGAPVSSLFELCHELQVTYLQLTVLQARSLMVAATDGRRLPPYTRVFLGAARMPPGFPRQFRDVAGAPVFDRYGTTEGSLIATTWPAGDRGIDDAVGVPAPGVEVEIVDASGEPVPRGEPGEIRIRSAAMASGYLDDPDATASHYRGGWFHPGDLGSMTEDGVLRFFGRIDDMMVLNGINIFPVEIERALEAHPAVAAAASFPIASPIYGDVPAVAVELREGVSTDERSLVRYARSRLGQRAPRRVFVVTRLPRNAAGKVVKRELVRMLAPGAGERGPA